MHRKILLMCVGVLIATGTHALPSITMPDLVIAKQTVSDADVDNPDIAKNVLKSVPKFSAEIRGALVKSGQFKVINAKTLADKIAYADDQSSESKLLPAIESKITVESKLVESLLALNPKVQNGLESYANTLLKQQQLNPSTDYYLIGVVDYIGENEDSYPLKKTNNVTKQYVIEVAASFKLLRAKDKAVMASFSATGRANDVKIVSTENEQYALWHHNIGRLVVAASKDLASQVVSEMASQFNFTLANEEKDKKASESVVVTDVKVYN